MSVAKLKFSGHETFHCRHFWLKKGYDYSANEGNFNGDESVIGLGVGKNMVSSINFWLKAFALKEHESNNLTPISHDVFNSDGFDPFIEDSGTLWLLQYLLVKSKYSSIYNLVFSDFRKTRVNQAFTKEQLTSFIKRKCSETKEAYNEKTVENDIKVFFKNYLLPSKNSKSIEDDFSALFIDLGIFSSDNDNQDNVTYFKAQINERKEIPFEIIFFAILDYFENQVSISFNDIKEMVANCFLMNTEGLLEKIEQITEHYEGITYKEDAGRKELQLKNIYDKQQVLKGYYEQ